ncbi:RNase H family protein [Canibacter zhoujuaniae]|uniref:RNase H family protein n=1 Tax=Canibacter zhoujuaniae TaxID=2708343 RepID=UPI001421D0DB
MTLRAATDGSALNNPGPAGWAWVIDADNWAAGGWQSATNNKAELTAILELLHATAHIDEELVILTDSKYAIDSITKWMAGWKRRGWRKADGSPVLNLEIMQDLDAAVQGRDVRFEWVKGHAGHPLNEMADRIANDAAKSFKTNQTLQTGPGLADTTETAAPAVAAKTDDTSDLLARLTALEARVAELENTVHSSAANKLF